MPDELLSVAQAAVRLGCSVSQVRAMCQEGTIPARKVGWSWIICAADLEGVTVAPPGRPKLKEPEP